MISVRSSGGGGKIKIPVSFAVFQPPNKTNYTAGEQLSLTGMKVMVTYSDDTMEDVTADCVFNPAPGTVLYEHNTKVSIAWTWENQIDYSCEQAITVSRVLQSIAIATQPSKKAYNKNEALNLAGMVVKATYTSGASVTITGYTTSPAAGAALSTLGNQTVTVRYTEGGITKTATFTVTVSVKVVTWAGGTDQEIADMVDAHYAGLLNLRDYWAVGQVREFNLAAMPATGVGESHAAQKVQIALSNVGGLNFEDGTEVAFQWDQVDALAETGYMNSSDTNSGGYDGSKRAPWCDNVYPAAFPAVAQKYLFRKKFNIKTSAGSKSTTIVTSAHKCALRSEVEIFGTTTYSVAGEGTQVQRYKTAANRVKKQGISGSAYYWWERSPYASIATYFCDVYSDGTASLNNASGTRGIAPFGCI